MPPVSLSRGSLAKLEMTRYGNKLLLVCHFGTLVRNPMREYYIYIISNDFQSVFYTGVTNDLVRRIYEHKNKLVDGFTKKYSVHKLLYFESTPNVKSAIEREKQIKDYNRVKKIKLIASTNPNFKDLYPEII